MTFVERMLSAAAVRAARSNFGSRILNASLAEQFARQTGLCPISATEPEDIFIVGYPKSGNTWMQNLICGAMYGVNPSLAHDSLVQDLVPDIHSKQFYRRYARPMFFKSHFLPQPEYRRVVYLVRDGRDVMVSYFHHLQASRPESDLSNMVEHGKGLFPCHWHEHIEAWQENRYNADILMIRYEDLQANTFRELQRICEFANEPRDPSDLHRAVEESSFQSMRAKETRWGWDERRNWPRNRFFVRRGVVGSHRDEMPLRIEQLFLRKASGALKSAGYVEFEPNRKGLTNSAVHNASL